MNWKGIKVFILVEVIIVIAIVDLISGIAIPSVVGLLEKSNIEVCGVNISEEKSHYEAYLELELVEDSDGVFLQYLHSYDRDVCPDGGVIIIRIEVFHVVCILRV